MSDIIVKFKPQGDKELVAAINAIQAAQKNLTGSGKKYNVSVANMTAKLKAQGKTWKSLGVSMRTVGKALQVPAKTIAANDPLAKKMGGAGFLSPITLGADIALAPITGIGYLEELAGDRGLQKKLAGGDPNTIIDTAFAGLSLVPMSGASKVAKKAKGGLKKAGRALGSAIRGLF